MKLSTDLIRRQYKAVIFDLDGTLIDSMWMWRDIDIEYLGRFGHELPDDYQKTIEGYSFDEVAQYTKERFGIPDDPEDMKAEWNTRSQKASCVPSSSRRKTNNHIVGYIPNYERTKK